MNLILILIAEVCIAYLTRNIIPYDIIELILLGMNIFLVGLYISSKTGSKKTFYIIYFGYLIRIVLMYVDLNIMPLPFSGADTWSFHNTGIKIAEALPNNMLETPYGVYAQFIGVIYYLFGGPVKMFAQHINITLFIISIIKIIEILKIYNVDDKYINLSMVLYTWFMPVAMFQSAILLREMLIVYFMTISICSFLKWLKNGETINIIIAYMCIFLAASFHSGLVFVILPYTYVIATYNAEYKKFIITPKSIMLLMIVLVLMLVGFNMFGENFVHLEGMENLQSILDAVNRNEIAQASGSGYLTELKVAGAAGLVLLTPLKVLYFLFSPMPWQIRGGMDAITFLFDCMLYVIAISVYIKMKKEKYKIPIEIYNVVRILYNTYLLMVIPYAWGTFAAGTAIRHRFKGFFIILIAYTIYKYYLDKYNEKNEIVRS